MLINKKTEIHGHRGCRGYYPENTLPAFMYALDLSVDAIELDVVISKDNKVVVSHEPFMHYKKCLWPNLSPIIKAHQQNLYLYQMNYNEIKSFDCGLISHPDYPLAKPVSAYKPTLNEVIEQVENKIKLNNLPIQYNIEIKSDNLQIGYSQPDYQTYTNLVLDVINYYKISNRTIIQSFDKEILRCIAQVNKNIPLSLLIEDDIDPRKHLNELGFIPQILGSDYIYLNLDKVKELQFMDVKIFAFTVNKLKHIQRMLDLGVDAIITDYPDVAIMARNSYKKSEK
ncbi:MAG TPA: glycerophosphodiester phosphodiesterase family protein [Bacteroidia bacterium]|nr:glycerophosphodiester phosphodiesterase family protein [Bacteroidia bacterium]